MEYIYYIIIAIGAFMVYGTSLILKPLKKENDVKMLIGLKFVGLTIAFISMLKVMKFI